MLLITNEKSHMGFQFVAKSVTLNNLERRNGHVHVVSPNSVDFCACSVKVVKNTSTHSASEM